MSSRDGKYFKRYLEPFIPPGPETLNWSKHSNFPVLGILPIESGMSIYYTQHYYAPSAHLLRAEMRTDGFVSARAPLRGASFITKPLIFSGDKLFINAATTVSGSICIEVQDSNGQVLENLSAETCAEFYGDNTNHPVKWNSSGKLKKLAGRPVRLQFFMRHADLYTMQFKHKR